MSKTQVKKTGKRPGNPNMVKGGPSINPKGKAAGKEIINTQVIAALEYALNNNDKGGAKEYFQDLANNHKALYVGMLQKVMPNETAVSVTVSLGDAMQEAQARIAEYENSMLDITPQVVIDSDANTFKHDAPPKPLKTNDT